MILFLFFATVAGVVAVAASSSAPSSSSSSSSGGPIALPPTVPLQDAKSFQGYYDQIIADEAALVAGADASHAADKAKIDAWQKRVETYGGPGGKFVSDGLEVAKWLAKTFPTRAEQNKPEDQERMANALQKLLTHGFLPRVNLTETSGAKDAADELERLVDLTENLSARRYGGGYLYDDEGVSTKAIKAFGALTIKWADDPAVSSALHRLLDAPSLGSSIEWQPLVSSGVVLEDGTPELVYSPKVDALPDLIGALVALQTGNDIPTMQAKAREKWTSIRFFPVGLDYGAKIPGNRPGPGNDAAIDLGGGVPRPFPTAFERGAKDGRDLVRIADTLTALFASTSPASAPAVTSAIAPAKTTGPSHWMG